MYKRQEELLRAIKSAKPERIDVIPWGVGEEFKPLRQPGAMDSTTLAEARAALKLPEHYVLYVGNIEPKKNLPVLIQAFFAAKMNKKLPHRLVIAGQKGWKMDGLERLIRELKAQEFVFFTGYVPQRALPALYSLADLFVMPSLVEGFGMPVLEAMACGCPVIISSDPALQEVAGSAAKKVPYDPLKPLQPLREAIEELLESPSQREDLAKRGLERAKLFTWEKTAALTRDSYAKALAES